MLKGHFYFSTNFRTTIRARVTFVTSSQSILWKSIALFNSLRCGIVSSEQLTCAIPKNSWRSFWILRAGHRETPSLLHGRIESVCIKAARLARLGPSRFSARLSVSTVKTVWNRIKSHGNDSLIGVRFWNLVFAVSVSSIQRADMPFKFVIFYPTQAAFAVRQSMFLFIASTSLLILFIGQPQEAEGKVVLANVHLCMM